MRELKTHFCRLAAGAALILAAFLPLPSLAEDIAIVVGVGKYPYLKDADLPGIDNDVLTMSQALKAFRFRVINLYNNKAGKVGIEAAFQLAAKAVRPGDRFVYYHSSHGSEDNLLLTYDTRPGGEGTITKDELHAWMESVRTPAKSLLIDACFSGGFMKSRGVQGTLLKTKFYSLQKTSSRTRSKQTIPQSDMPFASSPAYVIFTSSQADEKSHVILVNKKPRSVFTYYLGTVLNSRRQFWDDVVQPTVRAVKEYTGNTQTPVFTSPFLERRVFEGKTRDTPPPGTEVGSFLHLYSFTNALPQILSLKVQASAPPNGANAFRPGTRMTFKLKAQRSGYLFLMNVDDQNMAQMIPWGKDDLDFGSLDAVLEQSKISGELLSHEIEVGMGTLDISTTPRVGGETWKAFLFESKAQARAFVAGWAGLLKQGDRVGTEAFRQTKLARVVRVAPQLLATAEVSYKVTDK